MRLKPLARATGGTGSILGGLALGAVTALSGALLPAAAQAQEQQRRGATAALLEEVVVTARKREEGVQDVPLQVTAYSDDQIDALKIRDLTNLSVSMPNVALDDIATARGIANFSIRGLGVNSSIPSIDPTVGIIIDGVYMGLNGGMLFDVFDLESIQVLRGPQGTLFGRNVTGGAVLMNTSTPNTDKVEFQARAALDGGSEGGGLNRYLMARLSGPISDSLAGKVAAYQNVDDGWFENKYDGDDFGEADTWMARAALLWEPTESLTLELRYDHQETDGDGPPAQSHNNGAGIPGVIVNYDRDSFDFSIDETGYAKTETDFVVLELNWEVAFGDGTITNIYGWRDYYAETKGDIDATPAWFFHAPAWNSAEQWSNELRYNGRFNDNLNVTAGVFYFDHELGYHERRDLLGVALAGTPFAGSPAAVQDGGGLYNVQSWAVFAAFDYDATDNLTLSAGFNYSVEDKDVKIASLIRNYTTFPNLRYCNIVVDNDCPFDLVDDESWDSFAPKLGFAYRMGDSSQVYGHWSRGFRSGGYNLRNTSGDIVNNGPGPFDEEQVDNFEIGFKSELGGRGFLNAALFFNQVSDMQREVNLADPVSGVVQIIKNTADAEIKGLEIDGTFSLTENLLLLASLGAIEPDYTSVAFDLNGDGVVDGDDEDLELPRAAELTYSIGLTLDTEIGSWGYLTSRVSYAHRDRSYYNDNNQGYILAQNIVDAGLDFYSNSGHWILSFYGKNLLDEVKHGGDTNLPATLGGVPLGGTFSPLAKGRVLGIEITYTM